MAFKFGAAIRSNDNQPPKSLVKAIHNSFTTATTRSKSLIKTCVSNYGHVYALTANLICFLKFSIQHETKAKWKNNKTMLSRHLNFDVNPKLAGRL